MSRYKIGNDPKNRKLHQSWWHRGNCNFIPSQYNFDEDNAINKYILKGWVPTKTIIDDDEKMMVIGSCFAEHITKYLRTKNKMIVNKEAFKFNHTTGGVTRQNNVNLFAYGAGFVNTFSILQQFQWSMGEREIINNTLYAKDEDGPKLMTLDDNTRMASKEAILESNVFIITLGLSEVWYEKNSGEVFFGAIPKSIFNEGDYGFRVSSVEENFNNLKEILNLIRKIKQNASIIFTLSPVPLIATFRPISCITANSVSKAILRVAVDELLRQYSDDKYLYYWPSYEIVTEFFVGRAYREDRRHIKQEVIDTIMDLFSIYFIK